jgi:hypothetical protein
MNPKKTQKIYLFLQSDTNCFNMEHMTILLIKRQELVVLQTKKSVLSGGDSSLHSQTIGKDILDNSKIAVSTVDVLASAIKDVLSKNQKFIDKDITVLLDHSLYDLVRTDIPEETLPNNFYDFLREKYLATTKQDESEFVFEMIVREFGTKKYGFIYAFYADILKTIDHALNLLDIRVSHILPEHLAYYSIFDKTLRIDKHEYIMFVNCLATTLEGYYFDTFGPLSDQKAWKKNISDAKMVESTIKDKAEEWAKNMPKLNRIVLAGAGSEKIRQDTFTKNVGVWTNPLKRILPHFYQEYLNLLQSKNPDSQQFPALDQPALFGAFVASQDGKSFPFQKPSSKKKTKVQHATISHSKNNMSTDPLTGKRRFSFPTREFALFFVIFAVTFAFLYFVAASRSEVGISIPSFFQPTQTPTPTITPVPPTPTPTVEIKREEVSITILNGTGLAGQAGGIKTLLTKSGYVEVVTDNADNFDYAQSVVKIKSGKKYLESSILSDIKDIVSDPKIETLDASENADIVIIIGKDAN